MNQPPSVLVSLYRSVCETTSSFLANRHDIILPMTVLDHNAEEVSFLCRPRHVHQANFRQFSVNITHPMSFLGIVDVPSSDSPQIPLRLICVQAPPNQNPSLCERSRDSLTSSLFPIILLPQLMLQLLAAVRCSLSLLI